MTETGPVKSRHPWGACAAVSQRSSGILQLTDGNSILQGGWSWAYLLVSLPGVFLKITIKWRFQVCEKNLWLLGLRFWVESYISLCVPWNLVKNHAATLSVLAWSYTGTASGWKLPHWPLSIYTFGLQPNLFMHAPAMASEDRHLQMANHPLLRETSKPAFPHGLQADWTTGSS